MQEWAVTFLSKDAIVMYLFLVACDFSVCASGFMAPCAELHMPLYRKHLLQ